MKGFIPWHGLLHPTGLRNATTLLWAELAHLAAVAVETGTGPELRFCIDIGEITLTECRDGQSDFHRLEDGAPQARGAMACFCMTEAQGDSSWRW